MATQRTVEEAQKYLSDSLLEWGMDDEQKIISLASIAEKWRSSNGGPITKMRVLQVSIKALEGVIKRNEKVGIPSGIIDDQLEDLRNEYNELVSKYGEPKAKIKKDASLT